MCQNQVRRFDHILSYRKDYESAYVAALTIYLDDSGTAPDQPMAVVSGLISPYPQWKKFIREWNKARKELGFDVFHSAECVASNPKSEFSQWDDRRKVRAFRRLREIVSQRSIQGFGVAVHKKDYDELVPDELRKELGMYHYTVAVRIVIGLVEQWRAARGMKEPMEYIFDRMTEKKSKIEIDAVFEQAERFTDPLHSFGIYKGCHSFRDKAEILPLQAADILAWCVYQRALHHNSSKPVHQVAVETFDYFHNQGLAAGTPTRSQLAEWVGREMEFRQLGTGGSAIVKTNLITGGV